MSPLILASFSVGTIVIWVVVIYFIFLAVVGGGQWLYEQWQPKSTTIRYSGETRITHE